METANDERINGISCFGGEGLIDLAIGEYVRTVCIIENNKTCQETLKMRMQDGWLDKAPIWSDIQSFNGRPWHGKVDCLFGGFPCQDISNAGSWRGIKDGKRSSLFFEMLRLVGEILPPFIFLENVAGIYKRGLDSVLCGLTEKGYDGWWTNIRASEVGALQQRERWFCFAYNRQFFSDESRLDWSRGTNGKEPSCGKDTKHIVRIPNFRWTKSIKGVQDLFGRADIPQPLVCGEVHGVPSRVDRIRAIGNAVVPQQAREAWERLTLANIKHKEVMVGDSSHD